MSMTDSKLRSILSRWVDDTEPPFDVWSFLRDVLVRGAAIEADTVNQGRTYEQHSSRLDAAARELADILRPHLKPTGDK